MASPTWLGRGNEPTESDNEWTILQRILGALNDLIVSQGGDPMAEPVFLSNGSVPTESDTKWKILQRILAATRQITSGGVGAVYAGNYGGAAPGVVPTATAALAYDLDAGNRLWLWDDVAASWI